jgi:hypothetical protein
MQAAVRIGQAKAVQILRLQESPRTGRPVAACFNFMRDAICGESDPRLGCHGGALEKRGCRETFKKRA